MVTLLLYFVRYVHRYMKSQPRKWIFELIRVFPFFISFFCWNEINKATGSRAAFFIHTQQKNTATFFFGKCYSWRLLAISCNFRLLQHKNDATIVQQKQISLILLQFICDIFNVFQHNFSLRSIFSRGPYVQHIFAANTTVILS